MTVLRLTTAAYTPDTTAVVLMPRQFVVFTRNAFRAAVLAELERGAKAVVIDCSQTGYIDSAACGVLVSLNRKAREHMASLALRGVSDEMRDFFAVTRIDTVLDVLPRDAA